MINSNHPSVIDFLRKDEAIAALKVENAMLHLKLAQMQSDRRQMIVRNKSLRDHYAWEVQRNNLLMERLGQCSEELRRLRDQIDAIAQFARDLPDHFAKHLKDEMVRLHDVNARVVSNELEKNKHETTVLQNRIVGQERDLQAVKQKYEVEKTRRKSLHNALVEIRGNIRVHCRIRPVLLMDGPLGISRGPGQVVVYVDDEETVSVVQRKQTVSGTQHSTKLFEFDRVYGPQNRQDEVFEDLKPLLTSLLDGYNVCIMAYGQTGSGKTHTMLGRNGGLDPANQDGVIPLAAEHIFSLIEQYERELEATYQVEVTVAEIYMERVKDLLDIHKNAKHTVSMTTDKEYDVPTLTSRSAYCPLDIVHLVQEGMQKRAEVATNIHQHSSRSHLVITVTITGTLPAFTSVPSSVSSTPIGSPPGSPLLSRDTTPAASPLKSASLPTTSTPVKADGSGIPRLSDHAHLHKKLHLLSSAPSLATQRQTHGKLEKQTFKSRLQLVDLAGSECVGMSGVTGSALREAQCINKSLSALSDVLTALSQHKTHTPYRNSTLTHLLQSSIGGDAKMMVLLCISPSQKYLSESQRCLQFGSRARQIQRGPPKTKFLPKHNRQYCT